MNRKQARPDGSPQEGTITTELPEGAPGHPQEVDGAPAFGPPGRPLDRSSPLVIGFLAAIGVALAYLLVRIVVDVKSTLVLVGLSMFIAVGLEPLVAFLTRRRVSRSLAVLLVVLFAVAVVGGFVASAVSPITHEAHQLSVQIPRWRTQIENGQGTIGRLAVQFHINSYFTPAGQKSLDSSVASGAIGAGKVALNVLSSLVIVLVLTVYFLASLTSIKRFFVRLVPATRRPRFGLLLDAILARVGGYVLGNLFISLVAGLATFIWLEVFGIHYAVLLSLLVALFDLVPVVGSTVAGAIVSLVALGQSVPVAIATAGFYVAFRFIEDYLLVPRVMRHTVDVSAVVTVLATLMGAALLGVVGALVAIPIAAAVKLLLEESAFPRLDRT